MDRNRPLIVHQDYWHLKAIHDTLRRFLKQHAAELTGKRVLDLGSSNAPYRSMFQEIQAELILADIGSYEGILPIDPVTGRVPLPDGSVDMVLSTQVLEHVPEVPNYLAEAHRVLKPGGLMFLSTHGTWYLHRVPTDMRRWTIDGLRYDIERAGFSVETIEPHIGLLATTTHARGALMRMFLLRTRFLAPLRVITNLICNLKMGFEEMISSKASRELLPQLLIAVARSSK